tara:strand:- start:710 stop:2056 length:1347 start_codon:yes stop_codon:yes gene_type:complete
MAKPKKSRKYTIDGEKYVFNFNASGNLEGITSPKGRNGQLRQNPIDPNSSLYETLSTSDEAISAYNIANYGGNKDSYQDSVTKSEGLPEEQFFDKNKSKFTNESFLEQESNALENVAPKENASPKGKTESMMYPLDLNFKQDHFKITKYEYVRPDINQSKSNRQGLVKKDDISRQDARHGKIYKEGNIAGDGVINSSKPLGSIFLPMPKATDVNGVEWGKSELTISGLAALGGANMMTNGGKFLARTDEEMKNDKEAKDLLVKRKELDGSAGTEMASALYTQTMSKLAGTVFGVELDVDTVLARQGGRVLNPNAEMLFQGPVIRDFAFSFLMIARSQKEGETIRKILRFLKVGMAPKFRTTTYLKSPDVFTLEYKNGRGQDDLLKTVNQFNPGGLALTTMNVDYAPNGYWSAYRDSQPVILKMDLNFTELRPIYEGDQISTPEDSVGY